MDTLQRDDNIENIDSMSNIDNLLKKSPYSLKFYEKKIIYKKIINELTNYHYKNCKEYKKILDFFNFNPKKNNSLNKIPFLPVKLFKDHNLKSVNIKNIVKILTSSGTTGNKVSKIYLDKITTINQTKVLSKIMSNFIGKQRLPMLIIDTHSIIKNRNLFSARGAAIVGFSFIGSNITYALDENLKINFNKVENFINKNKESNFLIFGFTSMIYEYFYKQFKSYKKKMDFSKGIIIHGGGWKKISNLNINNNIFKKNIKDVFKIDNIYNYYGLVEQTGSIFVECEYGYLHCSNFSDVTIRSKNFSICEKNEIGLVQLTSILPFSYPGHIVLTEDLGEIVGVDNCKCGRFGKFFRLYGRVKDAEIRGCSDTYNN